MTQIDSAITEEEAALYDRQIRLWGLEAQSRLKNARILLVGVSPLSSEVVKNIVLAGVHSLTLADSKEVSETDLNANFLLKKSSMGQPVRTYPFKSCINLA